ncbi:CDP-alcohol phosphatidyltransferase family protein [Novosphingobium guangzhouense]|uniref:CDP-alcohol phosphatidyltransferase n=1 Tax=Novosphingobium guangzhouense TaxID=1850347 RepID=A0A2K2G222_9SPHN|nr:CDP-alcohol phosphatidyltransferase family protein [Novosphingobium guangzhouense]PNU05083.1 hypothetical protein A8V01_04475 [Novosphingobium guangzhouense]
MPRHVIAFTSARTAEYLVAGVPAAARALREVAANAPSADVECVITTSDAWTPSAYCQSECARLAPSVTLRTTGLATVAGHGATVFLRGEDLACGNPRLPSPYPAAIHPDLGSASLPFEHERDSLERLEQAGRTVIAATGKPGDGIVSRHLNRPVSQAISRRLLKIPGITPNQATIGTALLGLAMIASLLLGGQNGLVLGALLFQAASIFDGVDGEIARATWRMSARGAMLDSVIDAATNLFFIAGLTANLAMQGNLDAASAGTAGLAMLATGLFLIGRRSRAIGGNFTFDVVKHQVNARPSRLMQWLTWLTMRDFFAAAGALLIVAGYAHHALVGFAVCAALWLVFVLSVLVRTRPGRPIAAGE